MELKRAVDTIAEGQYGESSLVWNIVNGSELEQEHRLHIHHQKHSHTQ